MEVTFRIFRGGAFVTWEALFQEAADFAGGLSPETLIGISHSQEQSRGVVTVWYWRDGADGEHAADSSEPS